jgi:hypothetical protein
MTPDQQKEWNKQIVFFCAGEFDFEVQKIQEYHLRITINGAKKLDYFPGSRRATWVSSQKWFHIPDIEKFIFNNFKKS